MPATTLSMSVSSPTFTTTWTEVEIDGKMVRVQSLTDQINDKIRLMFETDGLKGIRRTQCRTAQFNGWI